MRTRAATVVLATSLGLGGLVTGVVLAPAMATAASGEVSATAAVSDRLTHLKDALKGLVSDGTLTQAQADEVATTLDSTLPQRGGPDGQGRGHGAKLRGAGLEAAAAAIGITEDELKTQLQAGKTLAQVAETQGVSKAALVDKLVAAARADLAQAVTDGKLTQAQADKKAATLEARITKQVDKVRPAGAPRHPRAQGDDAAPPSDSDESSPSAESSSAT